MGEKYLVTGGAGFIGSNIVRRLVNEGYEVRVLDNFSTGSRENLHGLDIELIEGDLTSYHMVQRAVTSVDYVLHQGALPSVPRSVNDPIASVNVNTLGTLNVLTAAREAGVNRLVYASSSSIYGDAPEFPKREDMLPSPKSPYAASKLAGEYLCHAFYETYGLETIVLRYFNVFGPFQSPHSEYAAVVPNFIVAGLSDRPAIVFGDGRQSRDFTFVDNVVEANLAAVTASSEAAGRVFNVACGESYSLLDLLDVLGRILEKRIERDHRDPRPGDVRDSLADVSAARDILGYRPTVGFQQGLGKTVAWLQESLLLDGRAG
jgi:nucleoside-diphosphate-sugar epimerase